MLASSTKKSAMRSTVTSSRGTGAKKTESFYAYLLRKFKEAFMGFWSYSRKFLWVSTTSLIVIILPFAFAYFMELQRELMKIGGMEGRQDLI